MGARAKQDRENVETAIPYVAPQTPLYAEGWIIWCGTEKLQSPTYHTLYDSIYAPHILKYWTKTSYLQTSPRIDPQSIASVDWDAVDACMKALPASKHRWNTKHGSENCGVGQTLFTWKLPQDNICPCCEAIEDTTHVLQCTAFKSQPTWYSNIEALINVTIDYALPVIFHTALHSCLTSWRAKAPFIINLLWPPELVTLMQSQSTLGWKNILEGIPSKLWIPYIGSHLDSTGSTLCPHKYLTNILLAGHHLAWSQWECRNHYLHEEGTPREKQALALLDQQVTLQFLPGPTDLPRMIIITSRFLSSPFYLGPSLSKSIGT
jgi:hypothetical protein